MEKVLQTPQGRVGKREEAALFFHPLPLSAPSGDTLLAGVHASGACGCAWVITDPKHVWAHSPPRLWLHHGGRCGACLVGPFLESPSRSSPKESKQVASGSEARSCLFGSRSGSTGLPISAPELPPGGRAVGSAWRWGPT